MIFSLLLFSALADTHPIVLFVDGVDPSHEVTFTVRLTSNDKVVSSGEVQKRKNGEMFAQLKVPASEEEFEIKITINDKTLGEAKNTRYPHVSNKTHGLDFVFEADPYYVETWRYVRRTQARVLTYRGSDGAFRTLTVPVERWVRVVDRRAVKRKDIHDFQLTYIRGTPWIRFSRSRNENGNKIFGEWRRATIDDFERIIRRRIP